eukprot:2360041-Pleurochrysis_carterae.AAC.1
MCAHATKSPDRCRTEFVRPLVGFVNVHVGFVRPPACFVSAARFRQRVLDEATALRKLAVELGARPVLIDRCARRGSAEGPNGSTGRAE